MHLFNRSFFNLLLTAFLCGLLLSAPLQAVQFDSGVAQTPLIELYTSEGCSSCPPADRFLSGLRDHGQLWQGFVPVAFHVDYWDYIGWVDPFANPAYSQRQRRYAAEYNESTVYTPGLRKAGQEWRAWRFLGKPSLSDALEVGRLSFSVNENSVDKQNKFTARFMPSGSQFDPKQPTQLTLAILGMGVTSNVLRGENRGKKLKHDFVVLALSTFAASASDDGITYHWQGELPTTDQVVPKKAVVAWLSQGARLTPLQAVGGYLP